MDGASYRAASDNYTMPVEADAITATHYRAAVRFGRELTGTRWALHGKFGVLKTVLDGGAVRVRRREIWSPSDDGWRGEFGLGATCRLGARDRLYLDYEYSRSAACELPWSLSAGYRRLW
jgi:outer membrane autotransporter protein